MMEDDLFGSNSLFQSFDKKEESLVKSSECKNAIDSGEGSSQEETTVSLIVEDGLSVSESNLVILDETGSEDDRESVEEVPKIEADSDIEVLEDSESTTELSSDPSNEKVNGEVIKVVKECQCTSCPHLKTIEKLKKENEQLRNQVEVLKSQHQIEIFRLEQLVSTSSSDGVVVTENKCESYSGFCIDKMGLESTTPVEEEVWRVPSYNTSFSDTLNSPEIMVVEDPSANRLKSVKSTCFNCMGDHMLNECGEKKDQQRISRNRQDYMSRNGGKQNRYHVENDLRFARFQPGRISDELRKALSLGRKELPHYIYKMRRLGYPPGWLKEAEISSSGIELYDLEVKEGGNEDGEVKEVLVPKGYNVGLPHGVRDEWKRYGYPPMQDDHVKTFTVLRKQAKKKKPDKRTRKMLDKPDAKRRRVSGEDMDIEEEENLFAEPLPPGVDPDESVEINNGSISKRDEESTGSKSPSLEDLESAKLQLMNQLVDGSDSHSQDSSEPCTPKSSAANGRSSKTKNDDEKPVFSASKFMQLGSPSIFQASKGIRLPPPEKFSVGISEHIPFENLPDTVGKYQNMKQILEKVRRIRSNR